MASTAAVISDAGSLLPHEIHPTKHMKHIIITFLLACSLPLSSANAAVKEGQNMPKLSQFLPGATLPNTNGKVVLVDFWASWCGPCKLSFPSLNKLQTKYGSQGLVIIGIGVDDDPAKYKSFADKMKASFSLVHDSGKRAAAFFGPPSMPTSYLIDRKGVIRHIHTGFEGSKTEAKYTTEIEALLAEKR
jgi:thiol-disulfide isomerase/thioredoxin